MVRNYLFRIISALLFMLASLGGHAAWINFEPQVIHQPDGTELHLFATGDEFYNWLHDADGYTIIQDHSNGYYYYAVLENGKLVASDMLAGSSDPSAAGIEPWTNISADEMAAKRAEFLETQMPAKPQIPGYASPESIQNEGVLNNLVVYIRFADQSEFTADTTFYYNMYNNTTQGYNSMDNYFQTVSYGMISIPSWFYPVPSDATVISYQDIYERSYFMPYDPVTNPNGYIGDQKTSREHNLLKRACEFIEEEVPDDLVIDKDNDGYVDNMVFTIRGGTTAWSTLLWPHRWALYTINVQINGKQVWDYNLQVEDHLNNSGAGVLCHEMFHSLGAPDLYHYNSAPYSAVGSWDLMDANNNPPQSMGAFMKHKYGGWIESLPEITECGTYTINPIGTAENQVFKIASPNSSYQYYVVEYRVAEGVFEQGIPGTGLLVYRIDGTQSGNAQGPPDEVYLYRPNGTTNVNGNLSQAHFGADYGRTEINNNPNPSPFLQNGSAGGLSIGNIGYVGETISFEVFFEQAPVADFMASETLVTPGCAIDFFDGSVCEVDSWEWTFEGGTPATSSEQHPAGVTWDTPGTYAVTLTAGNSWGTNSVTKTGYIEVSADALPEVEFFASDSLVCTSQVFSVQDFSGVCPQGWQWEITPGSFTFENGTNENSQHIDISVSEPGPYSVSLTVTNENGENTLEKTDYTVAGGSALPFIDDFETGLLEERGWEVLNPDDDITWGVFSVNGNGSQKAAGINLFNYFQILKRDRLISPPINLSNTDQAYLTFDHAYAQGLNTQYTDSLIVKISTDCGNSWTRILELGEDGSYNFATHPPYGFSFVPATADDWCGASFAACNTVNISAFTGQPDTRIMFESVRLTGNNLYVDNVAVTLTTGEGELAATSAGDIEVYPNPASGMVTVKVTDGHQYHSLRVINSLGQEVTSQAINAGSQAIMLQLAEEPRGLYFISFEGQHGNETRKLILH